MGEINHIELYLQQEQDTSPLKRQVYKEELERINNENPMGESEINIAKSYITNLEDKLEVGFFIRSTVKQTVSLEAINLGLINKDGQTVIEKTVDLRGIGIIPTHSGVPYEINFEIPKGTVIGNVEELSIKFVNPEKLSGFRSVETEIENMPEDLSFDQEQEILSFAHNLKTLRADELSVSTFKLNLDRKGNFEIVLLIRNGYKKNAKLQVVPISIINADGELVARHIFNFEEGEFVISPLKSRIVRFLIPKNEIQLGEYDITKCKVAFK